MMWERRQDPMDSPTEILYNHYAERYPINNSRIWERYRALQELLHEHPQQEQILNAVSLLVAEHEQEAFLRGIQIGGRLMKELEE